MTTGKPTPVELAAAATQLQRTIDELVGRNEAVLRIVPLPPETRQAVRARLVVCDRLSKLLARIIANGAAAPASGDVE